LGTENIANYTKMAQAVLDVKNHPGFGLAEPIKKFKL
jgi:hypothetical protein